MVKKILCAVLASAALFSLSACSSDKIISPTGETESTVSYAIQKIKSDSSTIAVKDGMNYILLSMTDGKVSKAEYAYSFGSADAAKGMYDYYEKNGYDPQYTSGRVDGAYLIMEYADQTKYSGLSEADIKSVYGNLVVEKTSE